MRKLLFALILLSATLFTSCNKDGDTRFNDGEILENDTTTILIERFDRDIFALDTAQLAAKYDGFFTPYYTNGVLHLRSDSELQNFIKDEGIKNLDSDVRRIYASCSDVESRLTVAFKYLHYYFPYMEIPRVLAHISGLNQNVVITKGYLSGSLDLYLGDDYEPYKGIINEYELPYMTRRHLPIDMVLGWLEANYPEPQSGIMLDVMLYYGKLTYILDVCFPDEQECELLSYSQEQFELCEEYENDIWCYLMENRKLYSTDWKDYNTYIAPSPFTNGLRRDMNFPGRIGIYIGYKIVKAYIDANPDATLQDLMEATDSQIFLQRAKYRP